MTRVTQDDDGVTVTVHLTADGDRAALARFQHVLTDRGIDAAMLDALAHGRLHGFDRIIVEQVVLRALTWALSGERA